MTHDKGLRALVRKWRAPDGHSKKNDYGHSFGCCAYELLDELEALLAAPVEPPAPALVAQPEASAESEGLHTQPTERVK